MINTNDQPLVSVIMNCYNGEKYIREAINSVLEQTYKHLELVIWDNCSTDHTSEIAKSYDDKRIRYFRADEYRPLGAARNLALKKSIGEFIAFLDCDDLWMPEKLQKQIPLFSSPKIGIVFCNTIFFNEKGDNKVYYKNGSAPTGKVFPVLLSKYYLSLETVVIRRSALPDDYWFDEQFKMIEEADLFIRIGYKWNLEMVKEILAKWRVHSNSWTWNRPDLSFKEKKLMLKKYADEIPNFHKKYNYFQQ